MTDDDPETCAVWYRRFGAAYYELCDDEDEAAFFAVALEDDETGAVDGVQFRDGRCLYRDDWQAFKAKMDFREAATARAREMAVTLPSRPARTVRNPFGGTCVVDGDEPDWLGAP